MGSGLVCTNKNRNIICVWTCNEIFSNFKLEDIKNWTKDVKLLLRYAGYEDKL